MKIVINYDLIDKIRESKIGISLHKRAKILAFTNGVTIPVVLLGSYIGNENIYDTLETILSVFGYSVFVGGMQAIGWSSFDKRKAIEQLSSLSKELNKYCVRTDVDLLKSSYKYHTEYDIKFDSFPPKVEQKKYIMVPVYNDWDNKERSLVQEHVMGTRIYTLSVGEPEKKKTYAYAKTKKANPIRY